LEYSPNQQKALANLLMYAPMFMATGQPGEPGPGAL